MRLSDAFTTQAAACERLGSPMYAVLLSAVADDVERGGASTRVLAGHEDDPGPSALALRLAGSVHRLVLERRAAELATYYPSVGGSWEPDRGTTAFLRALDAHADDVRAGLERVPQTNEVGRSTALLGGLLHLGQAGRLPVRLREIGSSAGLNLRVDHYACTDAGGRRYGPDDARLVIEGGWAGRPLDGPALRLADRLGCDVSPVDPTTTDGRLTLTSYVWPDQRARLERLRAALEVAARVPAEVRRLAARDFLESLELVPGTTTVLWHSVMWQYLHRAEQDAVTARIQKLGADATERQPFAHLALEPRRRRADAEHEFLVTLRLWPGGDRRVLGASVGHGVPTTWE